MADRQFTTERVIGGNVVCTDGRRAGTTRRVWQDPVSGLPSWVSVRTPDGDRLVPLEQAWSPDGVELHVAYAAERVQASPGVDHTQAELASTAVALLREHYELPHGPSPIAGRSSPP